MAEGSAGHVSVVELEDIEGPCGSGRRNFTSGSMQHTESAAMGFYSNKRWFSPRAVLLVLVYLLTLHTSAVYSRPGKEIQLEVPQMDFVNQQTDVWSSGPAYLLALKAYDSLHRRHHNVGALRDVRPVILANMALRCISPPSLQQVLKDLRISDAFMMCTSWSCMLFCIKLYLERHP